MGRSRREFAEKYGLVYLGGGPSCQKQPKEVKWNYHKKRDELQMLPLVPCMHEYVQLVYHQDCKL